MSRPSSLLLFSALALAFVVNSEKVNHTPSHLPHSNTDNYSAQVIIPYERVASRPPNNQFCQAKFTFCPNSSGKRGHAACFSLLLTLCSLSRRVAH
jgi:hypothetical protein